MTVNLLSKRGTLHKAEQTETTRMTDERCNVDSMSDYTVIVDGQLAREGAKRLCRRCFP